MQAQISEELRPFQVARGVCVCVCVRVCFFGSVRVAPEDAMDWDGALSLLASVDPRKAGCSARQCLIMLPVAVD